MESRDLEKNNEIVNDEIKKTELSNYHKETDGNESNDNSIFDIDNSSIISSNLTNNIANETVNEFLNDTAKDKEEINESSEAISDEDLTTDESGLDITNSGEDLKDEPFPETVTVLNGPYGGKVYLIGTAHFSEKSQDEVSKTIRRVRPNVVVVELCQNRVGILSMDEKRIQEESQSLNLQKIRSNIKEYGLVQGIMSVLFLMLSAKATKELGMAPGGEFRRAFEEVKKIPGCIVHLGDRPVNITLSRAISSLSLWQKINLTLSILFNKEKISKEDVEKFKQSDLLEEMLAEMTGEYPVLSKVFVEERDKYLAYSLYLAASPVPDISLPNNYRPATVVGIVGIGHVSGITKNWGKVSDEEIPPLLTLPERSKVSIVLVKALRYSFYGLVLWGAYKVLPKTVKHELTSLSGHAINLVSQVTKNLK